MNSATWIAIYLPIFILFVVIIPLQYAAQRSDVLRRSRKKGKTMTNEIIKKYIGSKVRLSTVSYGINIEGKIIQLVENWIEVETKKGTELINSEYIQNIKILTK